MKIKILSDIHGYHLKQLSVPDKKSQATIIAGDLDVPKKELLKLFKSYESAKHHLLFILGNHDLWDSVFQDTVNEYNSLVKPYHYIHFLHNSSVKLSDVNFIGSPLFSDYKLFGKEHDIMKKVKDISHDFKHIYYKKAGIFITPEDLYSEFSKSIKYIESELNKNERNIVISHFSPSRESLNTKYLEELCEGDEDICKILTPHFISNLDGFIENNSEKINLWAFGHIHKYHEAKIKNTNLICNPYGMDGYDSHKTCFVQNLYFDTVSNKIIRQK